MIAFLLAHKLACGIAAYLLFSSAVDGMPAPTAQSSPAYRWAHASLNVFAANLFRVLCELSPVLRNLPGMGSKPGLNGRQ